MPAADALRPRRGMRWLLWGALVALLLVAQSMLVLLTLRYEESRAQDQADAAADTVSADLRRAALRVQLAVQALSWREGPAEVWQADAQAVLLLHPALLRLERRAPSLGIVNLAEPPATGQVLFRAMARRELELETLAACAAAQRALVPAFSRSYFVPLTGGLGLEVVDVCVPVGSARELRGFLVATLGLGRLLDEAAASWNSKQPAHELSLVEADGTRLVRAGTQRGTRVFMATRLVDLPGASLLLRADAVQGRPGLIPNLAIALVLGLSLGLLVVVGLLARDMRRRSRAESALAEALSLRRAMEDSLVTGLRARDTRGRVTYVNPAFCAMVGFSAAELVGRDPPPYWPADRVAEYQARQNQRLSPQGDGVNTRAGYETVFVRRSGERFPVMIYEAPLLDRLGRHAGWMSAILDVSAERQMQEHARQQQERLQATARLATVGEMASLLSHELNQPLAAIASYATGSLNMMAQPEPDTLDLMRQAMERIAEQAERAGRVIKSVHGFVRRREQLREVLAVDQLIDAVLPLVRLQARKSGSRIELDLPRPLPRVLADRTMVEQVLLNLTRNALQAMDQPDIALARRVLTLSVRQTHPRWVLFSVRDAGPGIAPEVAQRLFTPFFTTREEGMGLGLSLCRTVIEQHGGVLDFGPADSAASPGSAGSEGVADGVGTVFRFTLPTPPDVPRPAPATPPLPPP